MKNLNEAGYSLFFTQEIFFGIFYTIFQANSYSFSSVYYYSILNGASSFSMMLGTILGNILGFLIWFIPNAIYIKKRKYLFYNLYSSPNNSKESYSYINYCNQCGAKKTRISDKKKGGRKFR